MYSKTFKWLNTHMRLHAGRSEWHVIRVNVRRPDAGQINANDFPMASCRRPCTSPRCKANNNYWLSRIKKREGKLSYSSDISDDVIALEMEKVQQINNLS